MRAFVMRVFACPQFCFNIVKSTTVSTSFAHLSSAGLPVTLEKVPVESYVPSGTSPQSSNIDDSRFPCYVFLIHAAIAGRLLTCLTRVVCNAGYQTAFLYYVDKRQL
jgi:hypothetical protein